MRLNRRNDHRGFSLVEVLVSVALTAVLMTASLGLMQFSSSSMSLVKQNMGAEGSLNDLATSLGINFSKRYAPGAGQPPAWALATGYPGQGACSGVSLIQRYFDAAAKAPRYRLVVYYTACGGPGAYTTGAAMVCGSQVTTTVRQLTYMTGAVPVITPPAGLAPATLVYPDGVPGLTAMQLCSAVSGTSTGLQVGLMGASRALKNKDPYSFGRQLYFPFSDRNPTVEMQ